ncbi:MAG: hypothetical protein ABIK60_02445, partial [candidate division WOR-3 bacterium]
MLSRFIKRNGIAIGLFLFDLSILILLLYLSFQFRLFFPHMPPLTHHFKKYLWFIAVYLSIFIYEGAYKRISFWDEVKLIWKSTIIINTVIIFFIFLTENQFKQYSVPIITWLFLC